MSRFLAEDLKKLKSYTPGEQPKDKKYIKLNTNESPYDAPKPVVKAAFAQANQLKLYSDPTTSDLNAALARFHNVSVDNIITGNGSDEILAFIMHAFGRGKKVMFPDVTYGFYESLCGLYSISYTTVPLNADFTVDFEGYKKADVVFLANPNAQTGISVQSGRLIDFIRFNKNRLVIIDEAYVDFGGQTVAPFIKDCDNLIVVRTFSKSRSLAGGRLGYALGAKELISELMTVKFSFNPYSVNRMTLAAGVAAINSTYYYDDCVKKIAATREKTADKLKAIGFEVLPSSANFLLARHAGMGGAQLKDKLAGAGILVRHFSSPRIEDYIRITIGSEKEMKAFILAIEAIIGEEK